MIRKSGVVNGTPYQIEWVLLTGPDTRDKDSRRRNRCVQPIICYDRGPGLLFALWGTRKNKQDLVDAVAAQTGASKALTNDVIDQVIEAVFRTVAAGETVQLIGFGSFSTGARAARTGRNPKTGEPLNIAASKTVKFTAGKSFKENVNK